LLKAGAALAAASAAVAFPARASPDDPLNAFTVGDWAAVATGGPGLL
jgi:hypothetical protein